MIDCEECDGTGFNNGLDCVRCDGNGEINPYKNFYDGTEYKGFYES